MENDVIVTGTTIEQLRKAIDLIFNMFVDGHREECAGINGFMEKKLICDPFKEDYVKLTAEEKEPDMSKINPTIFFYSHMPEHYNYKNVTRLPLLLDREAFTQFCWNWLKQFEKAEIDFDGSTGRGFTIRGTDFYCVEGCPCVSLDFTTMFYGK